MGELVYLPALTAQRGRQLFPQVAERASGGVRESFLRSVFDPLGWSRTRTRAELDFDARLRANVGRGSRKGTRPLVQQVGSDSVLSRDVAARAAALNAQRAGTPSFAAAVSPVVRVQAQQEVLRLLRRGKLRAALAERRRPQTLVNSLLSWRI